MDNDEKIEALEELLNSPGWKLAVDHYASVVIEQLRDELEGFNLLNDNENQQAIMTQGKITLIKEFFGYKHGTDEYQIGDIVNWLNELKEEKDGSQKG